MRCNAENLKRKINNNLGLPWTLQGEKAGTDHQIPYPRRKLMDDVLKMGLPVGPRKYLITVLVIYIYIVLSSLLITELFSTDSR